jgi:type VI secretion system protein ImpJ
MRQLQPVIWSKGTFLSPQHLQAQERFVEDSARFYLDSLNSKSWGFLSVQVDAKALSEGTFSIVQASGVFPDALAIDVPASDPPPPGRVLADCFRDGRQSCMFYLAIPQYLQGGVNVSLDRGRVSTRFLSHLQMVRDENNGLVEKPVQVARKNLQILAEGESPEGSVILGCARVTRSETGIYQLDLNYIPPLLDIHGNTTLSRILSGIVELLVTRSNPLASQRRNKNASLADFSASDIANFWLLYTINTHLPGLRHFLDSRHVAPERLFNDLSDLAGALTAFSDKIDPRDLPIYEHEKLGECFGELDRLIRLMLDTNIKSNFVSLPLKLFRDTIYATPIDKDAYFEGSRFYLAVTADVSDADIIDRTPKFVKAASATQVETLVRNALPGLRLQHLPNPPRALPVKLRYHYFVIDQTGPIWESIRRSRNFAVYAPSELVNPQMELAILLPEAR